MRTIFSTLDYSPQIRFDRWREILFDRMGPLDQSLIDDGPFSGLIETADIGGLLFTRVCESSLRTAVTPQTLRRRERSEQVFVLIQIAGKSATVQDGREAVQEPGDILLLANRPNVHISGPGNQSLVLELPRAPLERMLGSTQQYTALTLKRGSASVELVTTFLGELVNVHERLSAESATRIAAIGVDLIMASISERLAQDVPQSVYGNAVVQRAKAYVEANFSDPTLNPSQLAAAVGVSLRRLQQLFQERGQYISDWIWHRRLAVAVAQLADPGCAHLSIGTLAYSCGFSDQAHFSRRFKAQYGMTPSEYRCAALVGVAQEAVPI
ncbi:MULTISPECIES: helix-turn-helix domain-containing protein [unclassified Methylobacterium]